MLSVREHDARERHLVLSLHGVADHHERIGTCLAVRYDVIWLVEVSLIDILGGHSHAAFINIVQAMPHVKSGKLRALGTGAAKRSVVLPDVPTVGEAGALPGFENAIWWSFLTTAGTPAPIVNKLASELRAILSLDDVKTWFVNAGGEVDYLGPAELGRFIQKEIAKFKQIAKEANVKQE